MGYEALTSTSLGIGSLNVKTSKVLKVVKIWKIGVLNSTKYKNFENFEKGLKISKFEFF